MIIAYDLDEILADFVDPLLKLYNQRNGTNWRRDQIYVYDFSTVWGVPIEKAIEEVQAFYDHPSFAQIKPVIDAVEVTEMLARQHEQLIITARLKNVKKKTSNFIKKYFPNKFSNTYFTDEWDSRDGNGKKHEVCEKAKVDVMIEDSLDNAKKIAAIGIPVLLRDCPWNQFEGELENIIRLSCMTEIPQKLKEI